MRLKHLFTCILLHSILLPMDYNDGNSTTYSYLPDGTLLSREYGLKYTGRKGESNGAVGIASGTDSVTTDVPSFSDPQIAERPSLIVIGKTEYSGNIIYKNGKLDKVLFPGGYCTFDSENNSQPIFHYFTQDHLGNNRTVTSEDGTVEQITHYYPFGGTFNDAGLNASLQQYKYNGKELDRVAGLNTYDYGARQYFSALPVWDRVDPKCEEDYGTSPYVYCRNNPIRMFDNDGKRPGDFFLTMDAAAIDFELFYNDNSIRENREYGAFIYRVTNHKGEIGYSYNFATPGNSNGVVPNMAPNGKIPSARIHTHAAYDSRRYNNEFSGIRNNKFQLLSSREKLFVKNNDIGVANATKMNSYVVTPNGSLQKYDYISGKIKVISINMPSDRNDPNRLNERQSEIEEDKLTISQILEIMRNVLYEKYK